MDLWQLRIFCNVVELKSFSKAAEKINLSQPTVSSHVKALERHFGCRLVDRCPKEVLATAAGKLLYRYAVRLLKLSQSAETALAEFKGQIKGSLTIGGSTIPGGYLLPGAVGSFLTHYPDVRLTLLVGDTEKIVNQTVSGRVEISLVGARMANREIVQSILTGDEMRLVVPRGHRWFHRRLIKVSELCREPFVAREAGSGTRQSIDQRLQSAGKSLASLNVVAEMGSTEAVRQAIKTGVGVSILSTAAVAEELSNDTMAALRVQGLSLKRNFYLTLRKRRSLSPIGRTLIAFLKAYFSD
jgi:DNA-binding transcriptional LysR family regulator